MIKREINIKFILRGCIEGNRNCQQKLYSSYYGYAMSIALRYAKNRDEAVEILNDAFFKIFNNLDKFDIEQPFNFWMRRITINAAIDYHRKYYKSEEIILPLNESIDAVDVETPLPQITQGEDMLPILQQLPPAYRTVFNLYVMEEYRHQEIAELLGISVSTSRSNLMRAKEKLREIFSKELGRNLPQKNRAWKIF